MRQSPLRTVLAVLAVLRVLAVVVAVLLLGAATPWWVLPLTVTAGTAGWLSNSTGRTQAHFLTLIAIIRAARWGHLARITRLSGFDLARMAIDESLAREYLAARSDRARAAALELYCQFEDGADEIAAGTWPGADLTWPPG
jgi:hypothetical protein